MECPRFGKLIGGCRFEPRYDRMLPRIGNATWYTTEDIEALKNKTYVKDVCIRCGKEVQR